MHPETKTASAVRAPTWCRAVASLCLGAAVVAALVGCTGSISSTGPGSSSSVGSGPGAVGSSGGPGSGLATSPQCATAPLASGPAYIRRLTRWEYTNTIADVLNVTGVDTASLLLPDIRANGFSNDYGGQLATPDHAAAYQAAADAVSAALSATPTWLTRFTACTQTVASCRDQVVSALGLHLFRRPATTAEVASFGGLFDTAVSAGKTTAVDAAAVVVRAMLQSPQFLYRLEVQAPPSAGAVARQVNDYEMASRLSYLVWSSAPDGVLLAAAQAGQLRTSDQIRAQVARMIALPHAREVAQRYFREWLSLDDLDNETRGAAFTPQLAADMKSQTLNDVGDQLWDKGQSLLSMLTTKTTLVSPALAQYYGLGAPSADGHYALDGVPGRVGMLTHAGVLTINGDANASIVQRGLFIFRKMLCQDVPAPPSGATSVMLAPATASQRVQSDARLANEPCKSCHGQFDPFAYGFEPFDNMGGWQTKDVNGNPVRQDGWLTVPSGPNVPYTTIADYMNLLTEDSRVTACIENHVTQFAWGRAMTAGDQCMLEDIGARMKTSKNQNMADLVVAVTTSPYFGYTSVQ
jgi:hypothetical protein